jgi:hypothetical protein
LENIAFSFVQVAAQIWPARGRNRGISQLVLLNREADAGRANNAAALHRCFYSIRTEP